MKEKVLKDPETMIGLADGIALHNPDLLIVDSLIIVEFILRFSSLKYMTEILTPYKPVSSFGSTGGGLLAFSKSKFKSKGGCAFLAGPLSFGVTCLGR